MSRTLFVTAAEMAAGWIVRPDPADLLAAAAPCATCRGDRVDRTFYEWGGKAGTFDPCPDCRITLLGECPQCEGTGMLILLDWEGELKVHSCLWCNGTGIVTLGYAYPVGDVLPIDLHGHHDAGTRPAVLVENCAHRSVRLVRSTWSRGEDITDALAHYGDPSALVGQYALQIAVTP